MRPGVRLGVDVGTVRIGVARSDPDGVLAVPIETVSRGTGDVERICALASSLSALEVIVGLPLNLSGTDSESTRDARQFASRLAAAQSAAPVRLVDERLTTTQAARSTREAGRNVRRSRQVIDQAAAVVILQGALDGERASGRPPGVLVAA